METIPELYNIYELLDGMFLLYFKLIDRYQWEDSFLTEKLKYATYQKGYFRGGRNTIELVTYKDKIVIPHKLQRYVVKLYHTYILHPGLEKLRR